MLCAYENQIHEFSICFHQLHFVYIVAVHNILIEILDAYHAYDTEFFPNYGRLFDKWYIDIKMSQTDSHSNDSVMCVAEEMPIYRKCY